jgi:hypothetical protein
VITPKNAAYKKRQRQSDRARREARVYPSIGQRSYRLVNARRDLSDRERQEARQRLTEQRQRLPRGEAFRTRAGREYVVDPVTGQWFRAEKWRARQERKAS